jgi:hypothetical protein
MTCALCGAPEPASRFGGAPVCKDAEVCCDRRIAAVYASEVPALEDGDALSDLTRGVPHSPMTPAIARAWSEEQVNEPFISGWWRQDADIIPFPTEGRTNNVSSEQAA